MKQILIDGTTISMRTDGLSQYILNVVCRLPLHADRQYHIVVRPNECPSAYLELWKKRGITVHTAAIAPIGPKRVWQFRKWLRTQQPFELVLAPSNQFPTGIDIPTVYVIHDIIYERFPSQLGKMACLKRLLLHRNVAQGLSQAAQVIAVSKFTKSEILHFHPQAVPFSHYILYIGSSRGHKNLSGLLQAMTVALPQLPKDAGLVIAGDDSMLSREQRAQLAALKDHVITTGWLNQAQLDAYYRQAAAVIFPSLCEGFGIPVLEAFYYRKPLLLSNTSSLPEVAGEAGIYFDPTKPENIAAKMLEALSMSPKEQQVLIDKGTERLHTFSWQTTADQIDQIITNKL